MSKHILISNYLHMICFLLHKLFVFMHHLNILLV